MSEIVGGKELDRGVVKTECNSKAAKQSELGKQRVELTPFKTETTEPLNEENLFIKHFDLDLGILKQGANGAQLNKELPKDVTKATTELDVTKTVIGDVSQGGSLVWGPKYLGESRQMWCNDCGSLNTSPVMVGGGTASSASSAITRRCQVKQEGHQPPPPPPPPPPNLPFGIYDCRSNPYLKFDYGAIELRYTTGGSHEGKFAYDRKKCGRSRPRGVGVDDDDGGDKPYSCQSCDYKTTQRSKLKSHSRTHTGEKPYSCLMCDYRASLRYTLKKHMRTHTGEKPYPCDLCDYRASHKYTLKKHMLTHTGEKPFSCGLCDYRASLRYTLKKHMMTHTADAGYTCRINAFSAV